MDFEATGEFSYLDRFVSVLPSTIEFESKQLLASHSTQGGVAIINCGIPINQSELSNEIHGLLNPLYVNVAVGVSSMQPSCTLNDLEANTTVPIKRPAFVVPQAQDSVRCCSSASGGNAEAVSHSQSNSASDEAEDKHSIDERKQRRMLSNRESARRSRQRKQQHLDELRAQVSHLREENGQILNRFQIASQQYAQITEENCILRSQALELSDRLQRLQHTMTAQSHEGFPTFGGDTGHCNALCLGFESTHIAQSLVCSDLLF